MRPTWTIASNAYPDGKMQWYRLGRKFGCKVFHALHATEVKLHELGLSHGSDRHVAFLHILGDVCKSSNESESRGMNLNTYVLFVQFWAFSSASQYRLSHRHFWSPFWLSFSIPLSLLPCFISISGLGIWNALQQLFQGFLAFPLAPPC